MSTPRQPEPETLAAATWFVCGFAAGATTVMIVVVLVAA